MEKFVILVTLIALAACSGTLATPAGPPFALNTGHWQPTAADLQLPKPGGTE